MGLQKYRADKAEPALPNGGIPHYTNWMGGPSLALIRNCPVENSTPRTVYVTAEPDSFFSQPAACKIKGRDVRGFIMSDDSGFTFHGYHPETVAKRYKAEIGGPNWAVPPVACFDTLTECRAFAESYGTTAQICIVRNLAGRVRAEYRRDTNGAGTRWFKAF